MKSILLTASALALLASTASAQDSNLRFGLGVSTLGGTLEGAYRFNQSFALRGVIAGGVSGSSTETVDGVNFNLNGQLGGFALLADYYTGSSGFRVSGGAFVSNTSVSGSTTASPANPIDIGLTTLTGGETATVGVEFARKVSPILTVGYDWNIGRSFTLSGEIGAIAMGGLTPTVSTNVAVPAADLAREVQNINNQIGSIPGVYPYIAITGSFRF